MTNSEASINKHQERVQKTVEASEKPVLDEVQEKDRALTVFIKGVDQFQETLKAQVAEPALQEAFSQNILDLLKEASSPEEISRLQAELSQTLETLSASIAAYREWKKGKYPVENGDNLSLIVERELGIPWKEDPRKHFAIIQKLQAERTQTGTTPFIDGNGAFSLKTTSAGPIALKPGEYLDLAAAKDASPSVEAIQWFIQAEPAYAKTHKIVAEELAKEDEMHATEQLEEDLSDSAIVIEELRASYIQTLVEKRLAYEQNEEAGRKLALDEDFEDGFVLDPLAHGTVAFLEKALVAANAVDMWDDREKEQQALSQVSAACQENLEGLSASLTEALPKEKDTEEYKKTRDSYLTNSKRFVELSANIDETLENSAARNVEAAMQVTQTAMPLMSIDEAIEWTLGLHEKVDNNEFQSDELKLDYQKLFTVIKQQLAEKLATEKTGGDYASYAKNCVATAKLFSGRLGPIDDDLRDPEWASELAREAANSEKILLELINKSGGLLPDSVDIAEVIGEEKTAALAWIEAQNNPDLSAAKGILTAPVNSVEDLAASVAIIFQIQHLRDGEALPSDEELTKTVQTFLGPCLEGAQSQFEEYLEKNASTPEEIQNNLGISLEPYQVEGINLLTDIQGFGAWNASDKSWAYAKMGYKIYASIAIGVTVAIVTGPLGMVAAAIIGGAALTASNAVINQKGFEDGPEGFIDAYGKEMAVNTTTMGAARYMAAGRAFYQLQRSGAIGSGVVRNGRLASLSPEAKQIVRLATEKGGMRVLSSNGRMVSLSPEAKQIVRLATEKGGMRVLSSLDDGMALGNRLVGATMEGGADVALGTTLDTLFTGGSFAENLQNNAMFFGLGVGFEFGGPALRRFTKGAVEADDVTLNNVSRVNKRGVQLQKEMAAFCKENGLRQEDFLKMARHEIPLPDHINAARAKALVAEYQSLQIEFKENVGALLGSAPKRAVTETESQPARQWSTDRKEACRQFREEFITDEKALTAEELSEVRAYVGTSRETNLRLRGEIVKPSGIPGMDVGGMSEKAFRSKVDVLDSAVSKSVLKKDTILYRVVAIPTDKVADFDRSLETGDPAFVSTTFSEGRAKEALQMRNGILMEIRVPAGTSVLSVHSVLGSAKEMEVLLPRNLPMKVVSKTSGPDGVRYVVEADQVKSTQASQAMENATLEPEARAEKASAILGRPLSTSENAAVLAAHEVGSSGTGKYTKAELLQKTRILKEAGFSETERRLLMENGITGILERVNASLDQLTGRLWRNGEAPSSTNGYRPRASVSTEFGPAKIVRQKVEDGGVYYEVVTPEGTRRTFGEGYLQRMEEMAKRATSTGDMGKEVNTPKGPGKVTGIDEAGALLVHLRNGETEIYLKSDLDGSEPWRKSFDTLVQAGRYTAEARNILTKGIKPTKYIKAGGKEFYFSEVYDSKDGYFHAVAFVNMAGVLHPRFFYESGSAGVWRSAPAYVQGKKARILSKGKGIHYTQETRVIAELEHYLDQSRLHSTDEPVFIPDLFYQVPGTTHPNIDTYNREVSVYSSPSLKELTRVQPGRKENGLTPQQVRPYLENLRYPPGFIPNFEAGPMSASTRNYAQLGPVKLMVYAATLDGHPIEWRMAIDSRGRAWVDSIAFSGGEVSSFGTNQTVIDSGIITAKPLEYNYGEHRQALGVEGVDFKQFDETYADQTPLLSSLLPIKLFLRSLGGRSFN